MDSSKYTPEVPYGSSFTATHTVKGSPLAPNVPMLSLSSSWERCDRAGDRLLLTSYVRHCDCRKYTI